MMGPPDPCEGTPLVSVVIPARNEERFVGEAIESIRRQSYARLEIIVVDDYSSDGTADVVRSIADPRMIFHRKVTEPLGAASSRNVGVQVGKGALIAYQDADDYSHPNRIELQVKECLSSMFPRVVGCWFEEGIGSRRRVRSLPVLHEEIVAGFHRNYNRVTLLSATMLLPRAVALAAPMRNRFRCFEDWDQLCRISESGGVEFRNVPQALYTYNLRPKGSKGLREWSRYNIFERACRERRRAGLQEWASITDFEDYLSAHPKDRIRWGALRHLLQLKVMVEMKQIGKDLASESPALASAPTWQDGVPGQGGAHSPDKAQCRH